MTNDDSDEGPGPAHVLGTLSADVLAQIAHEEQRWRTKRLRQDLHEATRRLETAMQLLADATAFLDDEDQ